ncbi:MAG TPA: hypothetical protein VGF17_04945, partial [Phytomonospora sp.]
GDVDAAEEWMRKILPEVTDKLVGVLRPDFGIEAEILLARGQVDAGLRMWRSTTLQVQGPDMIIDPYLEAWVLEAESVTVVAHSRHGRVELVADTADALPAKLLALLPGKFPVVSGTIMHDPIRGVVLAAIAMADLARHGGDPAVARRAVRMIALAERMRFLRSFQPTMSPAGISAAARDADGPAYDEAVSSYAGLSPEALRERAAALLAERA